MGCASAQPITLPKKSEPLQFEMSGYRRFAGRGWVPGPGRRYIVQTPAKLWHHCPPLHIA